MRRVALTVGGTALGVVLLLSLKPHQAVTVSAPVIAPSSAPSARSSSSSPRVVDGDTVETQYGPLQVAIHVTGTHITAVDIRQQPDQSPHDEEIGATALPVLTQEALAAQSAKIDAVSGATYTSGGYIQSLQSAIDRAGL